METKQLLNELFNIGEHLSCKNYMTEIIIGFKYLEFKEKTIIEEEYVNKNYLIFFLKGNFSINCNQFCDHVFHYNEMILLPKCKHSVNHVFFPQTSVINFTSKKQSYDDTRRSSRDNELLQRAQSDL